MSVWIVYLFCLKNVKEVSTTASGAKYRKDKLNNMVKQRVLGLLPFNAYPFVLTKPSRGNMFLLRRLKDNAIFLVLKRISIK